MASRDYSYKLLSKALSSEEGSKVDLIRKHFHLPQQTLLTFRQTTDLEKMIHQRAIDTSLLDDQESPKSPNALFQKIKTLVLENNQEELNHMIISKALKTSNYQIPSSRNGQ
jgi:hypothetical protein